jgi:hypothetical protein
MLDPNALFGFIYFSYSYDLSYINSYAPGEMDLLTHVS